MNKVFKKLAGGARSLPASPKERQVKTGGKGFDAINEKLKAYGLNIETITPYTYGVYNGGNVIGYYDTLSDIRSAIKNGTITEPNL